MSQAVLEHDTDRLTHDTSGVHKVTRAPRQRAFLATTGILLLCLALLKPGPAWSQADQLHILDSVTVHAQAMNTEVRIDLRMPFEVVELMPRGPSDFFIVRFAAPKATTDSGLEVREALIPPDGLDGFDGVIWEGDAPNGPQLVLLFTKPVKSRIHVRHDPRQLVISVQDADHIVAGQ